MVLNCIPIRLFSPEISFAPLKRDLRMKGGGEGEAVDCVRRLYLKQRDKELHYSGSQTVLSAAWTAGESSPLHFVSF